MATVRPILDVFGQPDLERLIFLCADSNRACVAGLAALSGACREAAGLEYIEEPTGYRRVFNRISRVRPLMRSQIWYADVDERVSDSSYDSALDPVLDDIYGWQAGDW